MAVAQHRWHRTVALTVSAVCVVALTGCGREHAAEKAVVPPALVEQANADFDAGRYERAAEGFREILRREPDRLSDRRRLAYALAALGQFDEVDTVLRSAPITSDPNGVPDASEGVDLEAPPLSPQDLQADLMWWRRAFNIYRYYYAPGDGPPQAVFRTAAIRDALEATDVRDLTAQPLDRKVVWPIGGVLRVLQLWVRWDGVARDVDLYPNRRCVPVLVVREPDRLGGRLDVLQTLAASTAGAVWLHPDDGGNWLVHPGPIDPDHIRSEAKGPSSEADILTERVEPGEDLRMAWRTVWTWLEDHLPGAAVSVVVGVRPERGVLMDRRLGLIGRVGKEGMVVEHAASDGPVGALLEGFAMYTRLLRAKGVVAWSAEELEQLAHAYTTAGLSPMDFHTDAAKRLYAEDRDDLACLLSYVRRGCRLFETR